MNTAPKEHRALIFSIKQSGAPVGSALAGFLLPHLANKSDWTSALVIAALFGGATAVIAEPFRSQLDAKTTSWNRSGFRALFAPQMVVAPFGTMQGSPTLQLFAYAGFAFAMVQGSVFALYVTFLVKSSHLELAEAGVAFAAMQWTGAVARIVVGWFADRVARS